MRDAGCNDRNRWDVLKELCVKEEWVREQTKKRTKKKIGQNLSQNRKKKGIQTRIDLQKEGLLLCETWFNLMFFPT